MKTRSARLATAVADAAAKCELREGIEEEKIVTKLLLVAAKVDGADILPDVLLVKKAKPTREVVTLASCLDPGPKPESYFSCGGDEMITQLLAPHKRGREEKAVVGWSKDGPVCEDIMKKSILTPDFEQKQHAPPIHLSKYALKKQVYIYMGHPSDEAICFADGDYYCAPFLRNIDSLCPLLEECFIVPPS